MAEDEIMAADFHLKSIGSDTVGKPGDPSGVVPGLKQAVVDHGAVAVSVGGLQTQAWNPGDFSNWFKYTASDVTCYYPKSLPMPVEHGVALVGWDDDYPVSNFRFSDRGIGPSRPGAFLVKNSWGAGCMGLSAVISGCPMGVIYNGV
jgi:hypothetical protein